MKQLRYFIIASILDGICVTVATWLLHAQWLHALPIMWPWISIPVVICMRGAFTPIGQKEES